MIYESILPSSLLSPEESEELDAFNHDFKNFPIRAGVILNTYEKDSPDNDVKLTVEYDVITVEHDADGATTYVIYKKCIATDSLGSIADFFEFRRRNPANQEFKKNLEPLKTNGSFVLLFCLNGDSERGIILGALPHPKRLTTLTKEAGHHMEGEFNGVNIQINKDGEFALTFKSPSDNDGKYLDEKAGGSYVKIEKDGTLELFDGTSGKIRIDKTNETITVEAAKDVSITTQENVKITATKNAELKMKDLLIEASGKAIVNVAQNLAIDCRANFKVKGKLIDIQAESLMKLKSNNINIEGQRIQLGIGAMPAIVMSTMYVGVGNLGSPVISTAMGPFSSSVMIAS